MKPVLPRICDKYGIRIPSFHLLLIKHDFEEQLLSYQLTAMLNPGTPEYRNTYKKTFFCDLFVTIYI